MWKKETAITKLLHRRCDKVTYSLLFFDFEVFLLDWLVVAIDPIQRKKFVIVNDRQELMKLYNVYKNSIWIGYNSRNYDQWILKGILCDFDPKKINDFIIIQDKKGYQFSNLFYRIPLNVYDCMPNVPVGLKTKEAYMGKSIVETSVPFDIDRKLTGTEPQEVISYCESDVENTVEVFLRDKNEFDAYITLIKLFDLPLSDISKTKAQLAAKILGASKRKYDDEFSIQFPPTMHIESHTDILDFYSTDWNYDKKSHVTKINGVWHTLGIGGIHGADGSVVERNKYGELQVIKAKSKPTLHIGELLHIDVSSYYPTLNTTYPETCLSRSILNPSEMTRLKDLRLSYKKSGDDGTSYALKILINAVGGATKDRFNPLYDPRQNNNMCISGQVLLVDLLEKLDGKCQLCQSNTDGIIVKLHENRDEIVSICKEWEIRTGMMLEYHSCTKLIQKDVNNYILIFENGKIERKGAYVKELNDLDYDLPIVNKAVVDYLVNGTSVEATVLNCNKLREFQKVVKVSRSYKFAMHNGKKLQEKTFRVFASINSSDTKIGKCKAEGATIEKFANTPDHCFIENGNVENTACPWHLDKQWYINLANKRVSEFIGK